MFTYFQAAHRISIFKTNIFLLFMTLLVFVNCFGPTSLTAQEVEFGYTGKIGPEFWAELSDEWFLCSEGNSQSPIDINVEKVTLDNLPPIRFRYLWTQLNIINNKHTVEVKYDPGSTIKAGGITYELEQFHFHAPSEHTFGNGAHFVMEMHLVHRSEEGDLAVVAAFIKEGKRKKSLDAVWDNMPLITGEVFSFSDVRVHVGNVLPADRSYVAYDGSFTTPPCTEGVEWFLLKNPIELSKEQIGKFKSVLGLSCCPANNRPTQPLNGREVIVDQEQ